MAFICRVWLIRSGWCVIDPTQPHCSLFPPLSPPASFPWEIILLDKDANALLLSPVICASGLLWTWPYQDRLIPAKTPASTCWIPGSQSQEGCWNPQCHLSPPEALLATRAICAPAPAASWQSSALHREPWHSPAASSPVSLCPRPSQPSAGSSRDGRAWQMLLGLAPTPVHTHTVGCQLFRAGRGPRRSDSLKAGLGTHQVQLLLPPGQDECRGVGEEPTGDQGVVWCGGAVTHS